MYRELKTFCDQRRIVLIAVTKTRSLSAIMDLYDQGHRDFGENRVHELVEKYEAMPKDIHWHMIGHLQSNKVKYIASFVTMIHSGANYSLLKEINKRAQQDSRIIDVLLQIKIGKEETKSGWDQEDLLESLENKKFKAFNNIRIRGVMGMATFTNDENLIRSEFANLKSVFEHIKRIYFVDQFTFDTISMGMSGDYQIAAEEGATMIRVGSLLFE
jgi:pyridoxal phosphate enzyme (YggS family)